MCIFHQDMNKSSFISRYMKYIYKLFYTSLFKEKTCCSVVYKSDNFLIVNKAYDLKINSNDPKERTVQSYLKEQFPHLASAKLHHEFYFLHRLDYSTSGLLCIPVSKKACQSAAKSIREGRAKKYYIALVRGHVSQTFLDINLPIGRDSRVNDIEKMCVNGSKSIHARTVIVLLENGFYGNYPCSKILIRPVTGRRHQIRVHCSHMGHTIVGDYTYSNRKDVQPHRMFLHSLGLSIPNEVESFYKLTEEPFTEDRIDEYKCVYTKNTVYKGIGLLNTYVLESRTGMI